MAQSTVQFDQMELESSESFSMIFLKWGAGLVFMIALGWLVVEQVRQSSSLEYALVLWPGWLAALPAYWHRAWGLAWLVAFVLAVAWFERGDRVEEGNQDSGGGIAILFTIIMPLLAGLIAALAAVVGGWICVVAVVWGVGSSSADTPRRLDDLPYVALFPAACFAPWMGPFHGLVLALVGLVSYLAYPRHRRPM